MYQPIEMNEKPTMMSLWVLTFLKVRTETIGESNDISITLLF